MFVITEIEDNVEIRAAAQNKMASVEEKLHKKYSNKLVGDLGQAISIHDIISIDSYEMHSHVLVAKVIFRSLFFRFYPEEICIGHILSQDENGIILDDHIFKNYEVHPEDLFDDSEFVTSGNKGHWVWNYEGNVLRFYTGDTVRFRIKAVHTENFSVLAYMNEQGLGPCSWWD